MRKHTNFLFKMIFSLLFLSLFTACGAPSKTVAFYRVPENVQTEILAALSQSQGTRFKAIQLDSSLPFEEQKNQLKNAEILFALHDLQISDFARSSPRVKSIPSGYLSSMLKKISHSVEKHQNVVKTVPFLFDFYMIDVDYPLYKRSKVPTVDYWSDFLRTVKIQKNFVPYPITFAGASDDDLINLVGMLTEAFLGAADYNEIMQTLYSAALLDYKKDAESTEHLSQTLDDLTGPGGLLYQPLMELKSLINQELISSQALTQDVFAAAELVENEQTAMFFTKLSTHRTLNPEISQVYTPIYCPAYQFNEERWFVAPEYCALALNGSKETMRHIMVISSSYQVQLAASTGLAPVQLECDPIDEIANNVRYWLSGSNGALKPFTAALPSAFQRSFTSQYLRNLLVSF